MATKEKKQIAERVAIKGIVTGYVGYGLIFFFIFNRNCDWRIKALHI